VDAFERELAAYAGVLGVAALSSGTAAVHLGLKMLGVGAGDAVFCSSLTFSASANPILYEKAVPVFIDSEPDSWNMSPAALERALKEADRAGRLPRAAVIVDLYGQSADLDPLLALCERYGVPVLEDAAEALGADYKGTKCGGRGHLSVFSFNGNKIITTSGGGALVGNDLEALEKSRFWATQARDPAPHFEHSEVGYNYRMSNICAGIGRGQLRVLDARVAARRKVFARYAAALADVPGLDFMPEARFGRSNRWLTTLTLDPKSAGAAPLEIIQTLADENIEARPVWKPLHAQPIFAGHAYYPHAEGESVSDRLFETGLCLPSGSNLSEEDQNRVIVAVRRALGAGAGIRAGYPALAV
jgi:pyridoxal phosphate-dependent aminotransferase EpsN